MVLSILLLVTSEIISAGHAQSLPQLNFHFVAADHHEEALDVHLEEELDHILFGLMCKFSGNRFTARISPSQGATNLIDDSLGFTNDTEGAVPCLLSDAPEPVVCVESSFCELGNTCRASVRGVCRKHDDRNRWMMTQAVDVTLDQEDGQVVVTKCFTVCEPAEEEVKVKARGNGISYVTIIVIVVSVMVTPVFVVAAIVLYKLKDAKYLREIERKRRQFAQYMGGNQLVRNMSENQLVNNMDGNQLAHHMNGNQLVRNMSENQLVQHMNGNQLVQHMNGNQLVQQTGGNQLVQHMNENQLVQHMNENQLVQHMNENQLVQHMNENQLVQHMNENQLVQHMNENQLIQHMNENQLVQHMNENQLVQKLNGSLSNVGSSQA